jgi:phage shock protein PspC (stress-responsive transcriptional regulator)
MSVLDKIAYFQNRRDEVPNQELARELAASGDAAGIKEIADNLWHKNKSVSSDCLKVLYEIGYIAPQLIAGYVGDFLKLLRSKSNRMVWGAMIGLADIASIRPKEIWEQVADVIEAVEHGTLITVVWGVKTLARVAAADSGYSERIFPVLLNQLRTCIPRDVPMHAESIACAVNASNKAEFMSVLESRRAELSPSQLTRLKKAMKGVQQ